MPGRGGCLHCGGRLNGGGGQQPVTGTGLPDCPAGGNAGGWNTGPKRRDIRYDAIDGGNKRERRPEAVIKQICLSWSDGREEGAIQVEVVYSARRTLGLEVKADGSVLARVPRRMPDRSGPGRPGAKRAPGAPGCESAGVSKQPTGLPDAAGGRFHRPVGQGRGADQLYGVFRLRRRPFF